MKTIQYELEVYLPGSRRNMWIAFHSTTPFLAISTGDILNPGMWPPSQVPAMRIRVTGVEHIISEVNDNLRHKIAVFTEIVQ